MRWFETRGPVYPEDNYVVARRDELADFVKRIERGRYIVLFAPRQTGKTSFFRNALTTLEDERDTYFPIHLNFEGYVDSDADAFYRSLRKEICKEIKSVFEFDHRNTPEPRVDTEIIDGLTIRSYVIPVIQERPSG